MSSNRGIRKPEWQLVTRGRFIEVDQVPIIEATGHFYCNNAAMLQFYCIGPFKRFIKDNHFGIARYTQVYVGGMGKLDEY